MFDGAHYNQIKDIAMGSPLRPVLANPFMGFHEKRELTEIPTCELSLCRGDTDDIFCLFIVREML